MATPLACGQTKFHTRDAETNEDGTIYSERDIDTPSDFERAVHGLEMDVRDLENMLGSSDEKNFTKRVMAGQASRLGEWPWIVHLRNFHYGISTGVYSQVCMKGYVLLI